MTISDDRGISIQTTDGILSIRIDRPSHKNALDVASVAQIVHALEQGSLDESLRAVVIRGESGNFCSGADWVASNTKGGDARPRAGSIQRRTPLQAHRLIELLVEIQLPVVCVVQGWAAGLGCQIALAADFTVATDSSRFWQPFLQRGFSPDSGATWLLPRLVGVARAKELLLLGRELTGREAADWGLIHRAVPEGELDAAVDDLVIRLAGSATVALGLTKRCIHRALEGTLGQAMEAEANALELASRTTDFREGLAAFTERRQPHFEGR